MSPYEFIFKLHDLFTSPLARIANNYERVTGGMQRRAQAVSRAFAPVGAALRRSFTAPQGSVAELTQQIENLKNKARNIDVRVNRRGLIDTNREIQRMERRIDKLQGYGVKQRGSGGGGMGMLMAGGMVAGLAYGAYNTAEAAIGKTVAPAMQMEATKFQLAAMLKSKTGAENMVNQINAYAPEKSNDLLMAGRSLLGAGVKESDLMDGLKTLNNLAAFSNTDVKELAMIQAKIKATGRVQGDEMDMLNERGINLTSQIAKVMNIREDQVRKAQEKGLISYEVFQKALGKLAGPRGEQANFYENKRDNTTKGRYDYLMGKFNKNLETLGTKLLPSVNTALDWILKNAERLAPLQEPLSGLMTVLGNGFGVVKSLFQAFGILNKEGDLAKGFIENVSTAINVLSSALGVLYGVLQGIIEFVQRPIFGYDEKQMAEDERIKRRIKKEHFAREVVQRRQGRNQDIKDEASRLGKSGSGSSGADSPSIGKAAGLEASVSGAKSSVINITFKSFIERNEINVENLHEGVDNLEQKFMEMFTRLLAGGASIPD